MEFNSGLKGLKWTIITSETPVLWLWEVFCVWPLATSLWAFWRTGSRHYESHITAFIPLSRLYTGDLTTWFSCLGLQNLFIMSTVWRLSAHFTIKKTIREYFFFLFLTRFSPERERYWPKGLQKTHQHLSFNPLNAELNPICHPLALLGAHHILHVSGVRVNPLNTELNPICCLLALLGAHHFLHVSSIMVKSLTLRLLMSYIYIYIYIYIWSTHSWCF